MRNPWGSETYNGEWHDGDRRWTRDLKNQVGLVKDNDGTFFMPFDAFRQAFDDLQLVMYQDWVTESIDITSRSQTLKYYIESDIDQDAIITIDY